MKVKWKLSLLSFSLAFMMAAASCGGCNKTPTDESDAAQSMSDLTETDEEEAYSFEVDEVDVTENEDGTVTVKVKDKNGKSETVTFEDKDAYKQAEDDGSVPKSGDTVTVKSSSEKTKVEVTRKSDDGSAEKVVQVEATKVTVEETSETKAPASESKAPASEKETTKATEKETEKPGSGSSETKKETTAAPTSTAKESEKASTPTTTKAPETTTAAAHVHNWVEQTKTVHHDAITHVVHHDAVYETVTIPEEGHYVETVNRVEVEPAWDENISEVHTFCRDCGFDFTANNYSEAQLYEHSDKHINAGESGGWYTNSVVVQTIHHDAIYEDQVIRTWVVDKPAQTEQRLVREAYDETVVDQAAYDETVVTGYKCSGCGATR